VALAIQISARCGLLNAGRKKSKYRAAPSQRAGTLETRKILKPCGLHASPSGARAPRGGERHRIVGAAVEQRAHQPASQAQAVSS